MLSKNYILMELQQVNSCSYTTIELCRYPDELAWQLDLERKLIRQNDSLKRLHKFLVQETESVSTRDYHAWL